jgi:hypothetical protein
MLESDYSFITEALRVDRETLSIGHLVRDLPQDFLEIDDRAPKKSLIGGGCSEMRKWPVGFYVSRFSFVCIPTDMEESIYTYGYY